MIAGDVEETHTGENYRKAKNGHLQNLILTVIGLQYIFVNISFWAWKILNLLKNELIQNSLLFHEIIKIQDGYQKWHLFFQILT